MAEERLPTGIGGLDEVLHGGLVPGRAYLVRGGPGTGKTTLGFHFLTAGAQAGERVLLISLGEREAELRHNAASVGFDLRGIDVLDLAPTPEFFAQARHYDIFKPADVEREPTTRRIVDCVRTLRPRRVLLDATNQLRYLASDPHDFRRQVLSFLHYLVAQGATVLFTSESGVEAPDDALQFSSDGVLTLERDAHGRFLTVEKFRASAYEEGRHALRIGGHGLHVFPRLVPEEHRRAIADELLPFGLPALDELVGGGLERGLVTLLSGPSGTGKTTLGMQFMIETARRGERAVVYCFDEEPAIILLRCDRLGLPARALCEAGTLALVPVEPLRYGPEEFATVVRHEVEARQARAVMIDSVVGYRLALRGEELVADLHALCKYLKNMGVTALIVNEVETIAGPFRATEVGISYLADNILFLRYVEQRPGGGPVELQRAVGVLKKRVSDFEKTVRPLTYCPQGIRLGPPMSPATSIFGQPIWPTDREKD